MRHSRSASLATCLLTLGFTTMAVGADESKVAASKGFMRAVDTYLSDMPPKLPEVKPNEAPLRSLSPLVLDVEELRRSQQTLGKSNPLGDASPKVVQQDKLSRLLMDKQLKSVELVSVDFDAISESQLSDSPVALCTGKRPYCLPLRTSGWSESANGIRHMTATLGLSNNQSTGRALFVEQGNDVMGLVRIGVESYVLNQLSAQTFALTSSADDRYDRNKDDVQLPKEGSQEASSLSGREAADNRSLAITAEQCKNPSVTQTLNILVAITDKARSEGFAKGYDIKHLVRFAEALANISFTNSDINANIRIQEMRQTSYKEAANYPLDIQELLNPSGKLKEIRDARRSLKADAVVLVLDNPDPRNCGHAAGINVGKEDAYVVVNWRCLTDRFSFIHELGHLAGAWHDPATLGSSYNVRPPYAYGYITTGEQPLATIMAYRESCRVPCGRDWYWSNPFKKTDDGQVLGTVERNFDACVWRQRIETMALFDGG